MALKSPNKPKTEIISRVTRRELQEYFVTTTLRIIDRHFGDADIDLDDDFTPTETGERRGRVQKYYASLDFSDWESVKRFLAAYAAVLSELDKPPLPWQDEPTPTQKTFERLTEFLRRDGFEYKDGRIVPTGSVSAARKLKEDARRVDAPYLAKQVERIENQIESDPRLAIGTSKELVETVCKTILADMNVTVDRKWDLSELVRRTREELKLVPEDVSDATKAADTVRRLLGSLGSITQSLAELRNAHGTGHGHDGRAKGLSPRHARLAAGAACTLAKFLFETHQHGSD